MKATTAAAQILVPGSQAANRGPVEGVDDVDAALIRALVIDGRATFSALAELVALTPEAVRRRVRRLLDDGVVSISAIVDPMATWPSGIAAGFVVEVEGRAERVAEVIARLPNVTFVVLVDAAAPIHGELRCGNEEDLAALLDAMRALDGVRRVSSMRYLHIAKEAFVRPRRKGNHYELDPVDRQILERLQADGRASFASIGEVVGLSPGAVGARFQRMRDAGVFVIGAVATGGSRDLRVGGVCFVRISGAARAAAGRLAQLEAVSFAAAATGSAALIVTILARDAEHFLDVLDSIRSLEGVGDIESRAYLKVLKEDYSGFGESVGGA